MKAHLMFNDADFDADVRPPAEFHDVAADLELDAVLDAMGDGDQFLRLVAAAAVAHPLTDPERIRYRQQALTDALTNQDVVRQLYTISVQAITEEKRIYGWSLSSPSATLHRSIQSLELFITYLRQLRLIADANAESFPSPAFTELFRMLTAELSDAYFEEVDAHLNRLRFRHGVLISANLGEANKGVRFVLRRPLVEKQTLLERLGFAHPAHSMTIPDRDEAGFNALSELKNRGLNLVANALAQSTDHIKSFFAMLRTELAFYLGAQNLQAALAAHQEPICIPNLSDTAGFRSTNLYDAALVLIGKAPAVGNDIDASGDQVVVVTGANRGGKSTFLRSLGQAQIMTQCGLFAPAAAFETNTKEAVFTHFKREEDTTMQSGKLDEELARMSAIIDHTRPGSLILFNESFASTNEREGSEIARQITHALIDAGISVVFVTHLYDFAHSLYSEDREHSLFLRANREDEGHRTFKLVEGEPLPTSFGEDVFHRIFDATDANPPAPDVEPAEAMSLTGNEPA